MLRIAYSVPRISAERRELRATPAASSEAVLMRFPEAKLAYEVCMSRLTLEIELAAAIAALLVPIEIAIFHILNYLQAQK